MIFLNGINIILMEVHMFLKKFNHTRKIITHTNHMIINPVCQIINKIHQSSPINNQPLLFNLINNHLIINKILLFKHKYWIWNHHTFLTINLKCQQGQKIMYLSIEQQNLILSYIGHLIRIQSSNSNIIDQRTQNI